MKKVMNKINFAIVGLMASGASAFADAGASVINKGAMDKAICDLMKQFGTIFSTLRSLLRTGHGVILQNQPI